jgi:alanyl-tRNA synthetase
MMTSADIRRKFLDFFAKRGHAILPSASLVPRNDPSVLFNTAGMQPLVPYLLGEPHPQGTRLASCQKCVRTVDVDEVGDNRHLTFFEMLGNWSLGDYFKADAIKWSYEFLTSNNEGLGLDANRLYITVFAGDENAPRDMEAVEIWKQYVPEHRIYFLPAKNNWWSPGDNGPCGPDTEMFYDITGTLGNLTHEQFVAADDRGDVVEIWNDVFMEYEKKNGAVIGKLAQKNVDTGSGLERITFVVQGKTNVFEADLFAPAIAIIQQESQTYDERSARVIADHIRTAVFLLADGVLPGNKDQGYVLRRLIRRAVMQARKLGLVRDTLEQIASMYQEQYRAHYPEVFSVESVAALSGEIQKFNKTLEQGLKEFEKAADPFLLATTYGFPIELTEELAKEKGIVIDRAAFDAKMKAHQDASRSGAEQKFKGGLANTGEQTTKLHTAHHLLLAALQQVLGTEVKQRGSNITDERLRIDFAFDRKLTDEEKQQVEDVVNTWIKADYTVVRREMPKAEAEKIGAEMEFGTKYPDTVSVYFIEDAQGNHISKEFCGGPHVTHTGELGIFKIQKEEASSAGIRRIKAVLV